MNENDVVATDELTNSMVIHWFTRGLIIYNVICVYISFIVHVCVLSAIRR